MTMIQCFLHVLVITVGVVTSQYPTTLEPTSTTSVTECYNGPDILSRGKSTASSDINNNYMIVVSGQDNEISCKGFLTKWKFFPTSKVPLQLLVLRPIGSGYKIVGITNIPVGSVTAGVANEYTVPESSRIAVESGDVLGFVNCKIHTPTCGSGISYENTGQDILLKVLKSQAEATVGYSFDPLTDVLVATFSLSATVVPDDDECTDNTHDCHDDATCTNTYGSFTCACNIGYNGDGVTCTAINTACTSNPCNNGGTCVTSGSSAYTCQCTTDFMGTNCETAINTGCTSNPCNNGGTCVTSGSSAYTCHCAIGFTGTNCQTAINTGCTSTPCNNGGTCVTSGSSAYTCHCTIGFTGTNCQTALNTGCTSNPCNNGGTCVTSGSSAYTCHCAIGFTGTNCETAAGRKRRGVEGVTSSWPCKNGEVIQHGEYGSTKSCICQPGFTGILCEVQIEFKNIQPPIQRGHILTNGIIMVAMVVLMIVVVVLAMVVCRLTARNRSNYSTF
ncbi:uncharacterized protein [Amphiura filiformis]|uniref:uncharacterized protein isoform X3 n=1 Tax=Amphiura filiformis TaxID=82378 RepID=UPI003B2106D3